MKNPEKEKYTCQKGGHLSQYMIDRQTDVGSEKYICKPSKRPHSAGHEQNNVGGFCFLTGVKLWQLFLQEIFIFLLFWMKTSHTFCRIWNRILNYFNIRSRVTRLFIEIIFMGIQYIHCSVTCIFYTKDLRHKLDVVIQKQSAEYVHSLVFFICNLISQQVLRSFSNVCSCSLFMILDFSLHVTYIYPIYIQLMLIGLC